MEKKKFNCKMQDIPVITGFALASMERDKFDFIAYSPMFADPFMENMRTKQVECYEIVKAADVITHQKVVKTQLDADLGKLRLALNRMEGYLILSESKMDIKINDFGIKTIRTALGKGDLEKTIAMGRTLISNVKRNATELQAKGLKAEAIVEMEDLINNIDALNEKHNSKKDERSRATVGSNTKLNAMWDDLNIIINAGRALYRGVDNVKLKEYTITHLLKRVHNESSASTPTLPTDNNQPA